MEKQCEKCKFWSKTTNRQTKGNEIGECRKYAPKPVVGQTEMTTRWPKTKDTEFCFEFSIIPSGEAIVV